MQKLVCLILIISIALQGCKPTVSVQNDVTTDVEGSQKLSDVNYVVKSAIQPTYANPTTTLQLERTQTYSVNTIQTKDITKNWREPKTSALLIGLVAVVAGGVVASDIEDDPSTSDNEAKEGNSELGLAIGLFGVPFLIWGLAKKKETIKKQKISDGLPRKFDNVSNPASTQITVSSAGGLSKGYVTDEQGRVTIDLFTDLGLDYFENAEEATLLLHTMDLKSIDFGYTIPLSSFLNKYAKTKPELICLKETPSTKSKSIVGLPIGSKVKFLKEEASWVFVSVNDKYKGFLKREDVDLYYSREVMVEARTTSCSGTKSLVEDKAQEVLSSYYESLNFVGNPLFDKEEKETAIIKSISQHFKDPNLLIINDLNVENKKLKYRKAKEYFTNISGTFKELKFDFKITNFTYNINTGVAKAIVARTIEGTHFQDGDVANTRSLIFNFRFNINVQNYAFNYFYIEDISLP